MSLITKINHFVSVTLWQPIPAQSGRIHYWVIYSLRICYALLRQLATGQLNLRAMGLVFTTLLSLVPLLAVAFSVLKALGVHNQIEPLLLNLLVPLGAQATEISVNIIAFVENVKVGVLGSLGMVMLFYTSIALIQKIEQAVNFVWRIKRSRTLARCISDYLAVLVIGPVLVFSALALIATVMSNDIVQQIRAIEPFGSLMVLASELAPYLMIIVALTFLYIFIPNTKVKFNCAVMAAGVTGVLWITIGKVFALFVSLASNYTAIYSSFAILFFFMIWLYLAWLIVLTGAQIAFYLQHPKLIYVTERDYQLSPGLRAKQGLWLMTVIASQFYQQKPALTVTQLQLTTGLATDLIQQLLTLLEKGHLITAIAGEEKRYQPAQDIATVEVATVLQVLHNAEQKINLTCQQADIKSEQLLQKVAAGQTALLSKQSLRELVMDAVSHG